MKEVIKHTAKYIVLGIIVTALILAVLTLFLAMPSILAWVAGYLGGFLTYGLFILSIAGFIYWCLSK
jgi:hypothetical protein